MPTAALRAGIDYVRRNPVTLFNVARAAAKLQISVPLDLVRWGLEKIDSDKVSDLTIDAQPPGLGFSLTVSVMGNQIGVRGVVKVDEIVAGPGLLRVTIRVNDLAVEAKGAAGGPMQALLASGALDLSKPGNLMGFLPKRPAIIAEAEGDRFVLDLMKVGSLANNAKLERALGLVTPVVSIRDVETQADELLIGLRVRPTGLPVVLAALRS